MLADAPSQVLPKRDKPLYIFIACLHLRFRKCAHMFSRAAATAPAEDVFVAGRCGNVRGLGPRWGWIRAAMSLGGEPAPKVQLPSLCFEHSGEHFRK